MGLLDGQISKAIYAGFKGRLLKGRLVRENIADGSLDDLGDPVAPTFTSFKLEGFDDLYSEFIRASAGIPDGDVKVCIFEQSMKTRPTKDDRVAFKRKGVERWFQLRADATDPAEALFVCQAFPIPAPELP